jgi:hypothetical protein
LQVRVLPGVFADGPVAERGPKGSRRRTPACRFESCRAYSPTVQWRSEARRDRDAGHHRRGGGRARAGRRGSPGGWTRSGCLDDPASIHLRPVACCRTPPLRGHASRAAAGRVITRPFRRPPSGLKRAKRPSKRRVNLWPRPRLKTSPATLAITSSNGQNPGSAVGCRSGGSLVRWPSRRRLVA